MSIDKRFLCKPEKVQRQLNDYKEYFKNSPDTKDIHIPDKDEELDESSIEM